MRDVASSVHDAAPLGGAVCYDRRRFAAIAARLMPASANDVGSDTTVTSPVNVKLCNQPRFCW